MSTPKKPTKIVDLKAALKQLKSIGVPSAAKYDARKPFTKSQKETIRKNYRQYEEILTARSQYVTRDASKFTTVEKKALQDKGMKIVNDRLFVNKEGRDKISVRRKTFTMPDGSKIPTVKITKSKEGFRPETEYHLPTHMTADFQEHLMRQYVAGNFKPGDFIGIKIGNGGVAKRRTLLNMNQVFGYLADFEPQDPNTDKEELLQHVTIIKIHTGNGLKIHERTMKEKQKASRERSKARKQISNKLSGKVKRSK